MKSGIILNILGSKLGDYVKFDQIVRLLLGEPIYSIDLIGKDNGHGQRIKTISFSNIQKLLEYKSKIIKHKKFVSRIDIKIGYKERHGDCFFDFESI